MPDLEARKFGDAWYALRVRSRHENVVAIHLHARGYESFVPVYRSERRGSERFSKPELPLFPGYVFSWFNPQNRLPILTVPGIVHIVGVGKIPIPVDETEIASLQAAVKSGLPRQPWPFMKIGQKVRIERGPLCGVEGILTGFRGHERLVLSVTLLQRSVAVQVEETWVRPVAHYSVWSGSVTSHESCWQPVSSSD